LFLALPCDFQSRYDSPLGKCSEAGAVGGGRMNYFNIVFNQPCRLNPRAAHRFTVAVRQSILDHFNYMRCEASASKLLDIAFPSDGV